MSDKILFGIDLTTGEFRAVKNGDVISTSDGLALAGATGIIGLSLSGATGLQGLQGETGIGSTTGIQGISGIAGRTGLRGQTGIRGDTGVSITGLAGATGVERGATGIQGITGIQGVFFYSYIDGTQGSTNIIDTAQLLAIDCSSDSIEKHITLTLPLRNTLPLGKEYTFFNEGLTYTSPPIPNSTATIATQGGDTLNGQASYVMNLASKETVLVYNNGVEYVASFFRRGATGLLSGATGIRGSTGVSGQTGIRGATGI